MMRVIWGIFAYSWDIDTGDLMDMIETLIGLLWEVSYELFERLALAGWDYFVRLLQREYFGAGAELLVVLFGMLIAGYFLIRRFDS